MGDALGLTDRVEVRLANLGATTATTRDGKVLFVGKGKLPGAIEPRAPTRCRLAGQRSVWSSAATEELSITTSADPDKCADEVTAAILGVCKNSALARSGNCLDLELWRTLDRRITDKFRQIRLGLIVRVLCCLNCRPLLGSRRQTHVEFFPGLLPQAQVMVATVER